MEPASGAVCLLCRSHGTTYFGLVLPTKSAEEGTGIATPGMCFFCRSVLAGLLRLACGLARNYSHSALLPCINEITLYFLLFVE